jgi:hypothetical protein
VIKEEEERRQRQKLGWMPDDTAPLTVMSGSVHKYYSTALILIIAIDTKPSKNTLERCIRVKGHGKSMMKTMKDG